jgi:hypothetical protein
LGWHCWQLTRAWADWETFDPSSWQVEQSACAVAREGEVREMARRSQR